MKRLSGKRLHRRHVFRMIFNLSCPGRVGVVCAEQGVSRDRRVLSLSVLSLSLCMSGPRYNVLTPSRTVLYLVETISCFVFLCVCAATPERSVAFPCVG